MASLSGAASAAGFSRGISHGLESARQRRVEEEERRRRHEREDVAMDANRLSLESARRQHERDPADYDRRVRGEEMALERGGLTLESARREQRQQNFEAERDGVRELIGALRSGVDPQFARRRFNELGAGQLQRLDYDPATGRVSLLDVDGDDFSGTLEQLAAGFGLQQGTDDVSDRFAKLDPSAYTSDSIRDFQTSGGRDYSALSPRPDAGGGDQRDRRIEDAYRSLVARGLPEGQQTRDLAMQHVDGHLGIRFDPVSGTTVLVDELGQTAIEVPRETVAGDVPEPRPGRTLWELSQDATGPVSGIAAGASRVSGVVGGPVADETIQARQRFRLATQGLLTALREGGSRPLALELTQIFDAMDMQPSLFDNPEALRNRLIAVDEDMRIRIAQAERDAANPNLPRETRNASAASASALSNFLAQLGVPERTQGRPEDLPGWNELTREEQNELRELMR